MDLVVRPAVEADWPAVWSIFRAVVAGGDTYAYPPDIAEPDARAAWLHLGADGGSQRTPRTYVAELDGAIVGTALLRPNLPGLGDHVANAGWMVAPHMTGRGIGRQFAQAVIAEAQQAGYDAMQFNAVVATNKPAVALWTRLGFEIIGTIPEAFRHASGRRADLHVMHRSLVG